MKRTSLLLVIFLAVILLPATLSAQTRPRLAILPFTGGTGGDGETIAELFSFEPEIARVFTRVPRTSSIEAIMREQQFQRSTGLTDSDTIARLGRQFNADYVVSGHINTLGGSNLVHITIVHVESLQQVAGAYVEYRIIDEMISLINSMARIITDAVSINRLNISSLAVLPFAVPSSAANQDEAMILAQILATEIANTGRYIVLPRNSAIENIMQEHQIQRSGLTETENIRKIGIALNAQHVLSGNIRRLGQTNMFTVQILDVETGQLIVGTHEVFDSVNDGLVKMASLSDRIIGNTLHISSPVYWGEDLIDGNHNIFPVIGDDGYIFQFGQGEIRNGQLNFELSVPPLTSLSLLTERSNMLLFGTSIRSGAHFYYDNILLFPIVVFDIFYLIVFFGMKIVGMTKWEISELNTI
jgi:TolB-like protein